MMLRQHANGARRRVYMDDDRIIGYPDVYVQAKDRHPMDHLGGVLAERSQLSAGPVNFRSARSRRLFGFHL